MKIPVAARIDSELRKRVLLFAEGERRSFANALELLILRGLDSCTAERDTSFEAEFPEVLRKEASSLAGR